eukprot:2733679-Pyramimonas_sp.AAC.1
MQRSALRNGTPCYDMLHCAVLFYAMLCRALLCTAYPLGVIALLDIPLCESADTRLARNEKAYKAFG